MEKEILKLEIGIQKKLLSDSEAILSKAPEGTLFVRKRKRGSSYYQVSRKKCGNAWKTVHKNINNQPDIINALIEKKVAEQRIIKCESNIDLLNNMLEKYESCDFDVILETLPEKYKILEQRHRDYLL